MDSADGISLPDTRGSIDVKPRTLFRRSRGLLVGSLVIVAAYFVLGLAMGMLTEFLDWLAALATVSVAAFAVVALFIESERDRRDVRAEQGRRLRADLNVSSTAFLLSRQLRGWRTEIETLARTDDAVHLLGVLGELSARGSDMGYGSLSEQILGWWRAKGGEQDIAERRFETLLALAPDASAAYGAAIRRSFVKFFDFAGNWNQQAVTHAQTNGSNWQILARGHLSLDAALESLDELIDSELRQIRDEEVTVRSGFDELAELLASDMAIENDEDDGEIEEDRDES